MKIDVNGDMVDDVTDREDGDNGLAFCCRRQPCNARDGGKNTRAGGGVRRLIAASEDGTGKEGDEFRLSCFFFSLYALA